MFKFFLLTVLVLGLSFSTSAGTITGEARIIDGDTLQIEKKRIRLHGIDTPEMHQFCTFNNQEWPCGERAKETLMALIGSHQVHCDKRDMDRYGRIVAVCFANGINLNSSLVAGGWALAYRRYSRDYVDEEKEARKNRRGIWRGSFISPWEWRHQRRFFKRKITPKARSPKHTFCCKICRKGKACGNSCISRAKTCHKPRGCACDR